MSFFSWMRGARQHKNEDSRSTQTKATVIMTKSRKQSDSRIEYSPMEPSDIADAVAVLRKENDRANELCAKADLVIKRQEYELSRLRQSSEFLEFSNSKLIEKIKSLETKLRDRTLTLNNNSARLVHTERQLKVEQAKYEAMENELLESRLANRKSQYADLYHDEDETTNPSRTLVQHADLRPMPFVVVLVDGDSYRFLLKANTACDIQGRDIAHTLSREISKYILSHPRIPPHSKIVVRIFCNRSSMQGRMTTSAKKAAKATQSVPGVDADRRPIPTVETMVKFAETYPLFDYLDCGGGKERVDDKIRENCHLYMSDSNCHAIFLAVCNDNGYVRMLERYDGNAGPSAKVVLLTNGSTTTDMAKLSFPKVALEGVFENQYMLKIGQGSSRKMGPVLPLSAVPSYQDASKYDLDYTVRHIKQRIEGVLEDMRKQKQQANARTTIFTRLPYESNERYEERLKALVPLSRSSLSYSRSVANVGLRRVRPAGMLPSAPILPFMLHSETLQSTVVRALMVGGDLPSGLEQ